MVRRVSASVSKADISHGCSNVYEDKDVQEWIIKSSGLDWIIVRPGLLTNRPATSRYRVLTTSKDWRFGVISRADWHGQLICTRAAVWPRGVGRRLCQVQEPSSEPKLSLNTRLMLARQSISKGIETATEAARVEECMQGSACVACLRSSTSRRNRGSM